MKRAPSYRKAAVVWALVMGIAGVFACSNQSEGERCDFRNGDEDCNDGLICYREDFLSIKGADRCCPQDRAKATHPACAIPANVVGGDAAAPADSGPPAPEPDGSVGDAGGDAEADAGADAAADAGPDAEADAD